VAGAGGLIATVRGGGYMFTGTVTGGDLAHDSGGRDDSEQAP
jgi:hypothetical protein